MCCARYGSTSMPPTTRYTGIRRANYSMPGTATRPLCRPHQRTHDASESVAIVRVLIRLCVDARASQIRIARYAVRSCPVLDAAAEALADRSTDQNHDQAVVAVVFAGPPLFRDLYPGAGELTKASCMETVRIAWRLVGWQKVERHAVEVFVRSGRAINNLLALASQNSGP